MWEIDDGSSLTRASREPSGALAAIDAAGSDGFTLADLHGNLAAVVNAAETAYLSAVRYDPYGQTAATYDAGSSFPSPWGFQARLDVSPDAGNPLYEFGARFYAPATGAFTQLDSYAGTPGDPLSLNRYLYAAANPWTLVDPTGHKFEEGPDADGATTCTGCGWVPPEWQTETIDGPGADYAPSVGPTGSNTVLQTNPDLFYAFTAQGLMQGFDRVGHGATDYLIRQARREASDAARALSSATTAAERRAASQVLYDWRYFGRQDVRGLEWIGNGVGSLVLGADVGLNLLSGDSVPKAVLKTGAGAGAGALGAGFVRVLCGAAGIGGTLACTAFSLIAGAGANAWAQEAIDGLSEAQPLPAGCYSFPYGLCQYAGNRG